MKVIRSAFSLVALAFALTSLSACDKNQAACENYVEACGDALPSASLDDAWCENQDESECDISDYYDCLADACSGDDELAILAKQAECASKATCE